jgi:DNA-directed RNA polymerase specialized sigma24 family protein
MVPSMELLPGLHVVDGWKFQHGCSPLSDSQAVVKYVPFLRRYARALTGTQGSGDAYVAATLEAWLQDSSLLDKGRNPRVVLFQLFTNIWSSVALNERAEAGDHTPAPEQRLLNLTPQPRQAFLLLTMEGFSESEAAQILNCDIATVRQLVEECGRELAAELATDVLIIEDEVLIALDLEALVAGLGHRVIGVARTHKEAIALAQAKRPGLILADIQLADGSSGLEAVNELLRSFDAPVIFITAYPERFLTGERPEPAFLISKPFQPAIVSAIASQALFFAGADNSAKPAQSRRAR